jgi:hypothetical protein
VLVRAVIVLFKIWYFIHLYHHSSKWGPWKDMSKNMTVWFAQNPTNTLWLISHCRVVRLNYQFLRWNPVPVISKVLFSTYKGLKNNPQVSTICFSGSSYVGVMIKRDKKINFWICSNYSQVLFENWQNKSDPYIPFPTQTNTHV